MDQDNKMHRKSSTENPTRRASARAMRCDLSGASLPPRSMKNRAVARLVMMARNASETRYDMGGIIP